MKIWLITGASDGIGAELARQVAARYGAEVGLVLAARKRDGLDAVAAACRDHGASTWVVPTDVSVQAQCESLVDETIARAGRLDVLVNNAGVSGHATLAEVTDMRWYEEMMRINLWGGAWITHRALPHLQASRGQICAVSSLAGLVGVPGRTAYCASKWAQTGFFEALRVELLSSGVGVTIAYPGVVDTQIRHRGYGANGQPALTSGLDERGAMPVAECARLILLGIEARKREVVMTAKGKLGRWLKLLAPSRVDQLALAALKKSGGS
jgi:short-subunit dehydrogenase